MKRVAALCAGQGSQYATMGKQLYDTQATAREIFDIADRVLGFELSTLCFDGEQSELTKTANAQPAILTLSYAQARTYFDSLGVYPVAYAGHSLGEYTALVCAGSIDFADALRIVRKRGELMQAAATVPSGMAAVSGAERDAVARACEQAGADSELVVISNENAGSQTVISGHLAAVDRAAAALEQAGCTVTRLTVSAPFHSPYMEPAAAALREELEKYSYRDPSVPVIANATAMPYAGKDTVVANLSRQLTSPVRWTETISYLGSLRITAAVEIGPKQVLANLLRAEKPEILPFAFDLDSDRERWIEYAKPDAKDVTLLGRCLAVAVATRNQNFDAQEYRVGVVEPYNNIRAIQEKTEAEERLPSPAEMVEALKLLQTIFATKRTEPEEQRGRFRQILQETNTLNGLRDEVDALQLL